MDKKVIEYLINQHNNAVVNIKDLEATCATIEITDDKAKANFGNLCVALRGYRMIADATEAILINDDILKSTNGEFYQKIEFDDEKEQTEFNPNAGEQGKEPDKK